MNGNHRIKQKDIQEFEALTKKLNNCILRIRDTCPAAYLYATPGQLNLMVGGEERDGSSDDRIADGVVSFLDCGDW